ncbi:hypothetical protein [Pseudenhygromyxa sp. WMMC2535]|uniref:hypothetical protein n=1 Tax=Pseudenhygromyxa sp. WMMC2535 TaxID=2712867 RepID=UPI001552B0F7|nr:hypothetical protein [Pseudenhygromyxa sp. WMMC2535]
MDIARSSFVFPQSRGWLTALIFTLGVGALGCSGAKESPDAPRERLRRFRQTLEAEVQAVEHTQDMAELHWVELGRDGAGLSCIDGRADSEILGSPGGDAGELLLLLAAAEREGVQVSVDEVPGLIAAWVADFGSFYMHTDTHALVSLRRAVAADPRLADSLPKTSDTAAMEAWLRDPPLDEAGRAALLAHLVEPSSVGCGHLRSVLGAPEDYSVRPALAGAVIVGFYEQLWRAPETTRFVVLSGHHEEHAILDVEVAGEAEHPVGAVPLIEPRGQHDQVFVLQPQAVAAYRERAIGLFVARHPQLDAARLGEEVADLGEEHLEATLEHLGVDLPTIRVVVDDRDHHKRSIEAVQGR